MHATGRVSLEKTGSGSTVKVHSDEYVNVLGTGSNSTLTVNAKKNVNVSGTGSGSTVDVNARLGVRVSRTGRKSTVKVHSEKYVNVYETGVGSTVDAYAKKVFVRTNGRLTEMTKDENEYVIVTNRRWSGVNVLVATITGPSILNAASNAAPAMKATPNGPTVTPKANVNQSPVSKNPKGNPVNTLPHD